MAFHSLKNKLLTMMIALALMPLMGISLYAYLIVTKQMAQDRVQSSLEKMAQVAADNVFMLKMTYWLSR